MKIRKIIFVLVLSVSVAGLVNGQSNVEKIFRKYKNDENVVSLSFKGDLSNLLRNKTLDLKSKIEGCEFFMFQGKEDISVSDETKVKTALTKEKYETLINVRNKEVNAKVYAISSGETLSKVYAVGKLQNKNIYLILTGNIFFEELSKFDFNFDGAKDLKSVFK